MAGKLCSGKITNNAGNIRNSISFCEGLQYRSEGTAIERPVTGDPHEAGSEAAVAWETGWDIAEASVGGLVPKEAAPCCAVPANVIAA